MKGPRERFTATVDNYEKYRPGYPAELIDWIVTTCGIGPGSRIADVGCGTGISTRLFAARGFETVGIDPNEAMLDRARRAGAGTYVKGEAAATGLEPASVDAIVGGQAFHWFDLDSSFREFRRVLRPGGSCAAFWNVRSPSDPFLVEYDAILQCHSPEYASIGTHEDALSKIRARPDVRDLREAAFPNAQRLDLPGLLGRAWSSSYVVHGVTDGRAFDADLTSAFDRHQKGGTVDFVYRVEAIAWRL